MVQVSEISWVADYVFRLAWNRVSQMYQYKGRKRYDGRVNLDPYLRAIYILTVSKMIIQCLDIYPVQLKNMALRQEIPLCLHKCPVDIQIRCLRYAEVLYKYNGRVDFSPVFVHDVEYSADTWDYEFVYDFVQRYSDYNKTQRLDYYNRIPNNMFDGHIYFKEFVEASYGFFITLAIWQSYITMLEVNAIKSFIAYMTTRLAYRRYKSRPDDYKYMLGMEYLNKLKKYSIHDDESDCTNVQMRICELVDIITHKHVELKLNMSVDNMFEEACLYDIDTEPDERLEQLFEDIHRQYIQVVNVNPFAQTSHQQTNYIIEPFSIIYSPRIYSTLISSLLDSL